MPPSSGVFFSLARPRFWGYGEVVHGPAGQGEAVMQEHREASTMDCSLSLH